MVPFSKQPPGQGPSRLTDHEVHIWYIQADTAPDSDIQEQFESCLSTQEHEKYLSFKYPTPRQSFLLSRGCLRYLLGRYLALAPHQIEFTLGPQGKPALSDGLGQPLPYFNLSHSETRIAIALHGSRPLGIDIEYARDITHLDKLCQRCLIPAEMQQVLALPQPDASQRFLQYWTAKEALLKCLGTGLTQPMAEIEVVLANAALTNHPAPCPKASFLKDLPDGASQAFQVYQWHPEPNCYAALAVPGLDNEAAPYFSLFQVTPPELL